MAIWADYAGGAPGGGALRAAGFTGAIRYVGIGGGFKRLTAAEYGDLVANGIEVLAVAENTTTDVESGYSGGVANANAAKSDLAALGMPADTLVFAAADETSPNLTAGVDYVRGFRDTLGLASTGAYGFGVFVRAVQAAGVASVYWQAGVEPASGAGVHFWQRNGSNGAPTQTVVNGITCDINDQLLPLPSAGVTYDGGDMAAPLDMPAGRDMYRVFSVPKVGGSYSVSAASLNLFAGWGHTVDVKQIAFVGWPSETQYLGGTGEFTLATDTPTYLALPKGTAGVSIHYTADADWSISFDVKP